MIAGVLHETTQEMGLVSHVWEYGRDLYRYGLFISVTLYALIHDGVRCDSASL